MRTTKRFTPAVLERFRRQGRGTGIFESYQAWHQVTRGDPSSRGRSHILTCHGRAHDFLSDLERNVALFGWMHSHFLDLREQFPLSLTASSHELTAYAAASEWQRYPGTLEIADELKIRHPRVYLKENAAWWVMTTDILLTLRHPGPPIQPKLLAISCKPSSDLKSDRKRHLLEIEQAYWHRRGVPWLLITEKEFSGEVANVFVRTWHWGHTSTSRKEHLTTAAEMTRQLQGQPLNFILRELEHVLGSMADAQNAFWRSVWTARTPLALPLGWRPTEIIRLTDPTTFLSHNPILMGRSAWTN
jgi:hypothetical protein